MKLLDVVALTEDIIDPPLTRGQVGTVVEQLAEDVFEIEFAGLDGRAFCITPIEAHKLMPLLHGPVGMAA